MYYYTFGAASKKRGAVAAYFRRAKKGENSLQDEGKGGEASTSELTVSEEKKKKRCLCGMAAKEKSISVVCKAWLYEKKEAARFTGLTGHMAGRKGRKKMMGQALPYTARKEGFI